MADQREVICNSFILKTLNMENKTNILVLGHNGMLGHVVEHVLRKNNNLNVETLRNFLFPRDHVDFNKYGNRYRFIINCIGTVKPRINEKADKSILNAIYTNSILPFELALQNPTAMIINAVTDCAYDGSGHFYNENDKVNANDIYGRSKSIGEPKSENVINLRASIIGFEKNGNKRSLVEWFSNLPEGAKINGWTGAMWNGITTLAWTKIVNGIISNDIVVNPTQHIIPYDVISKYDLLNLFKEIFNRPDIEITTIVGEPVDRTLSTLFPTVNSELWKLAGYKEIPTIRELVQEMYLNK